MNLNELTKIVSEEANVKRATTERVIRELFDQIKTELTNEGEVAIPEFGKFSTTLRAARTGHNPATQEKIEIPASRTIKFKPSSTFKASVKGA